MNNKVEIYVNGPSSGTTQGQIELYGDEPISLTYSIADVKDISKRNSTFSQTFTVPATKNNNILFNHIFNIGSDSSFDPRKKTPSYLLVDSQQIFNGNLQLVKINVKNKNVESYDIVLYGEVVDLVKTLGGSLLTDLDFSELNHPRNSDYIEQSWTSNTANLGYYYPLIDYGYDLNIAELNSGVLSMKLDNGTATNGSFSTLVDGFKLWSPNIYIGKQITILNGGGAGQTRDIASNTNTIITTTTPFLVAPDSTSEYIITTIDTTNPYNSNGSGLTPSIFKPALSNNYLLKKILNNAGFSVDSYFIDTDVFSETIIPFTGKDIGSKRGNINSFKAFLPYNVSGIPVNNPHTNPYNSSGTTYYDLPFTDTSNTAGGWNYLNNYSASTFQYSTPTVGTGETYEFRVTLSYSYNTQYLLSSQDPTDGFVVRFYRSSLAVGQFGIPNLFASFYNSAQKTSGGLGSELLKHTISLNDKIPGFGPFRYAPIAGERFWVQVIPTNINFESPNPYPYAGDPTEYIFDINTNFTVEIKNNGELDNYTLMNDYIQPKIKQVDYIKSIITMFNLMVVPEKNNQNKLKFIPKDEYFAQGEIKDWSSKVDHNFKIEEVLISEQQKRNLKFSYKSDSDYYNTDYTADTNKIFGEYEKVIDNEWIEGEQKIEVIFAPTPGDKVIGSDDIYLPKIAKRDDKTGIYSSTEASIRFLRKNKNPRLSVNTIQLLGKQPRNTYPYCGNFSDPTNLDADAIDYNFGSVEYVYYNLDGITPNNLINRFWKNTIDDISDKNSKLINCKIYLTPADIAALNYNDSIYIDGLTDDGGHYYNINKINYNVTSNVSSTVELILVNRRPSTEYSPFRTLNKTLNTVMKKVVLGNSTTYSKNTFVSGEKNSIGTLSDTSFLNGNNNIIGNNSKTNFVYGNNNQVGNEIINSYVFGNNNVLGTLVDLNTIESSTISGLTPIVSGVTLLGVNDYTATTSDTVYVPNIQFTSSAGTINGVSINTITTGSNLWMSGTGVSSVVQVGGGNIASGLLSVAEGGGTIAFGMGSHAEGAGSESNGNFSHAEGNQTTAIGNNSHAEGQNTTASGTSSHSEGYYTVAEGTWSHAEGGNTSAIGGASHSEGYNTTALGNYSHSEGESTIASGPYSHAEGYATIANNDYAHAEGNQTTASGYNSHAEGSATKATGGYSHSEGKSTTASGDTSHAGGDSANAYRLNEWARAGGVNSQYGILSYFAFVTNATPTEIFLGQGAGSKRFNIETNSVYKVKISGVISDGSNAKEVEAVGLIKNVSGTVSLVGTFPTTSVNGDAALALATITVTADNTNKALSISVTGLAVGTTSFSLKAEYIALH